MNTKFCCTKCKEILQNNNEELTCKKCNMVYQSKNGYYDFSIENQNEKYSIPKNYVDELLKEVNNNGYELGTGKFVKNHLSFKSKFLDPRFDQGVDSIFHCIGKNNQRCLVLGSGLGNKVEILSHIFNEVYSVETMKELLIFQNKRFQNTGLNNISCVKSEIKTLPFTNDFFDLVVLGSTFSEFVQYYSEKKENSITLFLDEIKRVLKSGGCACFDIENQSRFNLFLGKNNFSPYEKRKRALGHNEYSKIFKNIGFKLKTCWVLPSLEKPYFSSNIEDDLAIEWYLHNFKNFLKGTKIQLKYRIFYKIFSKFDKKIIKLLTKKYAPSFVYYCYKEKITESIEDFILKETNFTSCVTISRRIKTVFVLLNNFGKAEYIIHFRRFGKEFPNKIPLIKRIFPKMANPDSRIWMEKWKDGRTLNPFNSNEVIKAIQWLFDFQDNSLQDRLTINDFQEEINMIKENITKIKGLDKIEYQNWLEEYKKFIEKNEIKKTAQHGDFAYANMLYNSKTNKISLIDWENYSSKGSPFRDLIGFIIKRMMVSSTNESNAFEYNIKDNVDFKKVMIEIHELTEKHFKCNVDINLLLKYSILKKVAELIRDKKDSCYAYIKLLHIVEKNNFPFIENSDV